MSQTSRRLLWSLLVLFPLVAVGAKKKSKKAEAAEDGLPTREQVTEQVRPVYQELSESSDPMVRRAAFEGALQLEKEDIALAVTRGLAEADWEIQGRALAMALEAKDKKLRKKAEAALTKLLESGDETDREHGMALLGDYAVDRKGRPKTKMRLKWLQKAAKLGAPGARAAARAVMIEMGGKTAWKLIAAGLKEGEEEAEHKEALKALETYSDPLGAKWALATMHDATHLGDLARDYLVRLTHAKSVKKVEKAMRKQYEKSADFETRLRIASVLARRGHADVVRTLLAGLKFQKRSARIYAWHGLAGIRDLAVLGKLRARILSNQNAEQADAAYAWLTIWAKANAEPQVLKVLQEAARSDRRPLRLRAMKALTTLKHRASAPLFESAMTEGQNEIRLAAAMGLAAVARSGDEKRLQAFLKKEPDPQVKAALVQGLAHIGTPAIVDPLQHVMMGRHKELKLAAAQAIAATGTPAAALRLSLLKRDPDVGIRFLAWHSLLRLKPNKTAAEFRAALSWLTTEHVEVLGKDAKVDAAILEMIAARGNDDQRFVAVDALRSRGEVAATRLLGLVTSPHADTASVSLGAIAELRKEKSVGTYRKALKNQHGAVRAAAYKAIGNFGPRALLETVLGGLADKEPLARARAAAAAVQLASREIEG